MPPKTFKCTICGEEVSRPKSYCINEKGDRACRTHQETQEQAQALQDKAIKEKKELEDYQKRKQERKQQRYTSPQDPKTPRCMICNKKGLHQRDFHWRMLIASKKLQTLGGEINIFSSEYYKQLRKMMISPDATNDHELTCLWIVQCNQDDKLYNKIHCQAKISAQILGAVMICPECVEKNNVELPQSNDTLDQFKKKLEMGMLLNELIKDDVKEIAKQELKKTAEKN